MTHLARSAPLAIAATLAFGSTSLMAQDVTASPPPTTTAPPVIVLPDPVPATSTQPAPTIVIPDELTQPEPAAAAPVQPPRAAPRQAAPAQTRTVQPTAPAAAEPAPATPDDTIAESTSTEATPLDAPIAAAPEPIAEPEAAPIDQPSNDNTMAIVLGLLAALAMVGLAFLTLRRRTSPKRYAAAPKIEPSVARKEPVVMPEVSETPAYAAEPQPTPSVTYAGTAFASKAAPSSSSLSHSGAAVALPREVPSNPQEREALIHRMVEAQPDRANPFRSKRARAKRARLILASLGREFKHGDPWIDLSQYPSNWPELNRRQSVAA